MVGGKLSVKKKTKMKFFFEENGKIVRPTENVQGCSGLHIEFHCCHGNFRIICDNQVQQTLTVIVTEINLLRCWIEVFNKNWIVYLALS